MHLRFLNNCSQLASHHEPLSARRRTFTCGWWFVGGPIVAQLYVRIGFFYKVIRNMATEKLQVQKVPIEISIPNSTLDAWIQRGLGGPDPTPPPIPLKITCSMGFYRNKHPPPPENKQKDIYPHLVRRNATPYNYFLEFQMFTGETLMRLSVCTYKTQSVTGKWAITYF